MVCMDDDTRLKRSACLPPAKSSRFRKEGRKETNVEEDDDDEDDDEGDGDDADMLFSHAHRMTKEKKK